jgi:tRNA uridine 5-carboxymethylaminomethyl modification enzyme
MNAAKRAGGGNALTLDRAQAYIGVLIDDLVTRGISEPYRMFTSRAEYRLSLRADNADQRLTPIGIAAGIVGAARARAFSAKMSRLAAGRALARGLSLTPSEAARHGLVVRQDGVRRTAGDLLALPGVDLARLATFWPELRAVGAEVAEQLEIDAHYSGYLERQEADVIAFRRDESLALPRALDYAAIDGLSTECRIKLATIRPATLGQAARIDGITPAALSLVLAHVRSGAARRHAATA